MEVGQILLGRFKLLRWLGTGGAGELLLVEDLKAGGETCALKILRPRVRDPGLVPLFKSEFLILSEAGHPSIVAVRDFGVLETDEPFFTMDFVPGENCRVFVREDRLEAHDYVDLAAGLLSALAHVHARGILHRDIKPENVIVQRREGRLVPVLVDFGLAVLAAAARSGEASGTLPYIAPEVLSGAAPDARADLFSLGMVLHEVATGKQPAERKQLLGAPQRTLSPDRMRRRLKQHARGAVPRRFEDFVARLTAPTPVGRYPSAAAALDALASLYGREAVGGAADVAVRPTFGESPLVGRSAPMDSLMQRVDAIREGRLLDPIVVVAGAEGAGVTRLLSTVRNHATVLECTVCAGRSLRELATDIAFHPEIHAPPPEPGEGPRELVFRADAAISGLGQTRCPIMILDDVQGYGEQECAALRDWITSLESRPGRATQLLVLGGRSDGDAPGAELLRTAGRAVPVELRDLAPLASADIRSALATVLGRSRVPTALVQSLHRASGGNPRLFNELLRLLVVEGVLAFDEEGEPVLHDDRLSRISLPRGIQEAARRRAKSLEPAARDLLARFALIDGPLTQDAARRLDGTDLALLIESGFLVRDRGFVRFHHELARRAADTLKGAKRARVQRESADALAEAAPDAAARLLVAAGELDHAREVGLPAARAQFGSHELGKARDLLRLLAGDRPGGEAGRLLVRALYLLGDVREAAATGVAMVKGDDDLGLVMTTCSALLEDSRAEDALSILRQRERGAEGDSAARITNAKAAMLSALGRYEEALHESRRAEAALGSLLGRGGAIARTRANIFRRSGHRAAALRVEDALLAADGEHLIPDAQATAYVNRANFYAAQGRLIRALRDTRRGIVRFQELGFLTSEGVAWQGLGVLFLDAGRPSLALKCFEKARALGLETARDAQVGHALAGEAESLLSCGRPLEAEARLGRAAALPRRAGTAPYDEDAALARARLDHLSGRHAEALEACERLMADDSSASAVLAAQIQSGLGNDDATERAWRRALGHAWRQRRCDALAAVRVGLAECAAHRGAWRLAESILERGRGELLQHKTPVRAHALLLRATASLQRGEPGVTGRLIEEAVVIANRSGDAPLVAEVYSAVASLLEEGALQRYLRRPTGDASAALLEVVRDVWATYGNEAMLRKIDLHLSELPRPAADPLGGPDADRLVKVLHVAREMNREFDRDRLLGLILDRAIELTGAERGFVILLDEGRETVHLARNIDREAVSEPEAKISSTIIKEVIRTGRIARAEDAETDERFEEYLSVRQMHLKSVIAVPFRSGGKTVGALYLDNRFRTGNFTEREERLLELFADQAVAAIDKAELVRELESKRGELEEVRRSQKTELRRQGRELRSAQRELKGHRRARGWGFDRIVARSVAMQVVVREARRFAVSDLPILVTGENGTGKEMLATAIHYGSRRESMPFLAVNCAAFPEGLLEAELFGHVRGSFTGADRDRAGLFEEVSGGTLFLDEVGDMSLPMQVRLLRALENGEVRRVGESRVRTVDVRVVAATNSDLEERIRRDRFREDLYYRLSGCVLHIPPLRERLEDVEPLAYTFVEEAARREGRPDLSISNEAIARLESATWSGNVRELRNVLMRAVVTAQGDVITADDVAFDARVSTSLPGLDPGQIDRIIAELASRGLDLNRRHQTGLARVLTRGKLGFGEYQQLFRISKSTTARDLDHLMGLDLLEKRGRTRAVVYLPGPHLREVAKKAGRE